MATCATCGKSVWMGGETDAKDPSVRFCSKNCKSGAFMARFGAALTRAAEANPDPLPALVATTAPLPDSEIHIGGNEAGTDLIVVAIGLGVAAAVAALIYWLADLVNYPFHSQTVSFVLPIGALFCGVATGAGFWAALRWFDRLPSTVVCAAAAFGGVAAYVLIHFLSWWLLEIEGEKVRDHVGFLDFLQHMVERQRLRFRGDQKGFEVGKWGYARFAINSVGFALGAFVTVTWAGMKPYCPRCRRYFKSVGSQSRSWADPDSAADALHPIISGIATGRFRDVVELHSTSHAAGGKGCLSTTISVAACPSCGEHLASFKATVKGNQGDQPLEGFAFAGKSHNPVRHFS